MAITVTLTLDRLDLISLAKGTTPYYSVMDHELIKHRGSFTNDSWRWHYGALEGCDEQTLLTIYQLCKDSWKVWSEMHKQSFLNYLDKKVKEVECIRTQYTDIPSAKRLEKYWEGYRDALKNLSDELKELPTKWATV